MEWQLLKTYHCIVMSIYCDSWENLICKLKSIFISLMNSLGRSIGVDVMQ